MKYLRFAILLFTLSASAMATVTMDWVTVGNPGNLAQSSGNRNHGFSGGDGNGKVDYTYQIGKYMVTNDQYVAFLNAVAKSDPHGLYSAGDDPRFVITRSGSDGSYTYTVKPGMGNKPVTIVSWFDAARMANWMHNGQGSGSTETGAYTLNGANSGIINKSGSAKVWIPSENEWFKAAYYNGDTGMYSLYATGADTITTAQANYASSVGTFTDVGAYHFPSFYGTFDQSGNAYEWTDTVTTRVLHGATWTELRVRRGGDWWHPEFNASSADQFYGFPDSKYWQGGFRLASVPEPMQLIAKADTWVTENFNAMGSSSGASLPIGWRVGSARDAIDWSNGLTTTNSAGGTTGSGSISGGGCYNFADGINASSTDRALGFLGSDPFLGIGAYRTPRSIIYAFRNDTDRPITALDLEWNYEKYRNGQRTNQWTFFHGSSSSPSIAVTAGDQSYPSDGNTNLVNPPTSIAKSLRIDNLNIAPGALHYLRWTYTGISGDANSHALGIDDFSIRVLNPTVSIAANLQPFTASFGSASAAQSFTVDGTNLLGDITVTAPTGFQVSADNSTFSSNLTLTPTSGNVTTATIHVRIAPTAPSGSISGNITLTSSGVETQSTSVSGNVIALISPSVSSLSNFTATSGTASASQSFNVNGGGLLAPVTITAPAGFQVSTDNSTFSSSVSVAVSAATIQSVYRGAFGNDTTAAGDIWANGSGSEFPNRTAFAAITSDGSVVTWGNPVNGGDSSSVAANLSSNVTAVFSNETAFAALKSDGSVVTWGQSESGGDSSSVSESLSSNVTAVFSTLTAFAALKSDGSVVTWGNASNGGDSSTVAENLSSDVTAVYSTDRAFAALKSDGSVVTWGNDSAGAKQVVGSVSVAEKLSSNVTAVYSNTNAFAALKSDGSVVTWGGPNSGGDSSSVAANLSSNVVAVYSSESAFAALKSDGSVVTWGNSFYGGDSSFFSDQLSSNVTAVYSTGFAFAALKSDGSVVTWGNAQWGGSSSSVSGSLSSNVTAVFSTRTAFAALKSDGSVVTWGWPDGGGDSSSVSGSLSSNVTAVFSNLSAFAALKSDGSVVTWGLPAAGGDSSSVAANLSSNVTDVFSNIAAFAALKSDGSVVTWGNADNGGSGGPANIGAPLYVRMDPDAPLGAISGNLTLTSVGASPSSIALTGFVSGVFTPSITSLSGFSASEGNASAAQSFTLNGTGVTAPVQVTAPTGFEVSLDGVNFSSSLVLQGEAGRIATVDREGSLEGRGQVWARGSGTEFPNFGAFAVILPGGSVAAWGNALNGGDVSSVANLLQAGVSEIYSNTHAFAALKEDGSVVTWGNPVNGGDSSAVAAQLAAGVVKVSSTRRAFAALKEDGSVVVWGALGSSSTGQYLIPFSDVATQVASGVVEIYSASDAFAALKNDGSVVTWGSGYDGGDSSRVAGSLQSGVVEIVPITGGFAARKSDGSVVSWGAFTTRYVMVGAGEMEVQEESAIIPESLAPALASGVVKVVSSGLSFAAIKDDGSVITWGSSMSSAEPSAQVLAALQSGVVDVFSNRSSMAALKEDGSVVTWGGPSSGGDSSTVAADLATGVVSIFSNEASFAALKNDGSVVTWGHINQGGLPRKSILDPNGFGLSYIYVDVTDELSSGVVRIQCSQGAFSAIKSDGSVVAWGDSQYGGDERAVASLLTSGVLSIHANHLAFVAQKDDGSLVSWGNSLAGASGGPESISGAPTFPVTLHVRMASGATSATLLGNLSITSAGMETQTIALSGSHGTPPTTTPYETWVAQWFALHPAFNGAEALPDADPDGDGISNLMEYALGLDPNTPGVIPAALAMNGTVMEYSYTRSTAAREGGLVYQIEWSDTLEAGSWSTENVTEQIESTAGALETVKASVPAGSGGRRFLRLRVEALEN